MDLAKEVSDLKEEFHQCKSNVVKLEIANADKLGRIETQLDTVIGAMSTFVTLSRFRPVELIALGLAGGVMTTALGMVLAKAFGAI